MAKVNLNLNLNFFQNKKGRVILPEYFDKQLNEIVKYINVDLIPYLESVQTKIAGGVLGDPYSVLCNVQNNMTEYQYLSDINFDDNLLSLSKLKKYDEGSVIASDIHGDIVAIIPDDSNLLLFGSLVRNFKFRKIRSDDLSNNLITGDKLQILNSDNFADNTFVNIIADNSITEDRLSNVSNVKIADECIDFKHLGVFSDLPYNEDIANLLDLGDFDDGSISSTKIKDASILWNNFIEIAPIYANNLVPMHITDSYLIPYVANTPLPNLNIADLQASNFSAIINFPNIPVQNVRLTREKITNGVITKNHFDPEVRAAIDRCIQIRDLALLPPPQVTTATAEYSRLLHYENQGRLQFNIYNSVAGKLKGTGTYSLIKEEPNRAYVLITIKYGNGTSINFQVNEANFIMRDNRPNQSAPDKLVTMVNQVYDGEHYYNVSLNTYYDHYRGKHYFLVFGGNSQDRIS